MDAKLDKLSKLTSCEVSDALLELGISIGGLITDMNMYSPRDESQMNGSVVGPAFTCKLVLNTDKESPKLDGHFVDHCPSGTIMLMQLPAGLKSACWGGLMSTAAAVKGVQGVVIDGGCRDLPEHKAIGFPVFARYHSTLGTKTFARVTAIDVPLTFKPVPPVSEAAPYPDVVVNPRDILVCDSDGVVVVPQDRLDEVIEKAVAMKDQAEKLRVLLQKGVGVQEGNKQVPTK